MKKYRIKKTTKGSGDVIYRVQERVSIFLWEDTTREHIQLLFNTGGHIKGRDHSKCENAVEEILYLKKMDNDNVIVKTEIINID